MTDHTSTIIRVNQVTRVYETNRGSFRALDPVTFQVSDGEFLSIVGPSGCGKSTLLRIIGGLVNPSAGTVEIAGSSSDEALLSFVFQEYSIFPWRNVAGNVRFGLECQGFGKKQAKARAATWIDRVGLNGFEHNYPASLSGGMKQRVALARALALEPELLLMDEPFAALDAQRRQLSQAQLISIHETYRRSVVFITHSIDEALLLSDRIIVMSSQPGHIKETYPVPFDRPRSSDVRAEPSYRALEKQIWQSLSTELTEDGA